MNDYKKSYADEREIVYSRSIKAGMRIYYLDVKRNRKDEMYLAITESKKIVSGEGENQQVSFEKHKIFVYQEDLEKVMQAMLDIAKFIEQEKSQGFTPETDEELVDNGVETPLTSEEIKIDIEF